MSGVESLAQEPAVQTAERLRSLGKGLSRRRRARASASSCVLIDVLEGGGDGGARGVAVHAERLHLAQDAASAVAFDGDVVPRPRPRGARVVEQRRRRPASASAWSMMPSG